MFKFSDTIVQQVWEKGYIVNGYDPAYTRKDQCGAWIKRLDYGDRKSQYGWEIDHITPESNGGGDELSNLRPLQWQNNASKQEGKLTCPVRSK
ncbi:HNH endonuclease [Candidatus Roizmanbacteria bacterium CG23_combo_of_CG06-09_8_20_14_all_35_49]|uniref:HNH endonuclease n=1 Tax=Candidatus Roizmanbacteria bacterium CG23_combo_of_CG06-09_8_20_14_all_35_49 TaxID=1974863 RepID=A0A2G9Y7Y2_9BACT|nr:MAG: HNH endonuclease [Candidatus Roizmanbacteria bacterium CG23_combo_of_CG06-09_8_20_14_all_35_49]